MSGGPILTLMSSQGRAARFSTGESVGPAGPTDSKGEKRAALPRELIFVSLPRISDSSGFSKFFKVRMGPPDISAST